MSFPAKELLRRIDYLNDHLCAASRKLAAEITERDEVKQELVNARDVLQEVVGSSTLLDGRLKRAGVRVQLWATTAGNAIDTAAVAATTVIAGKPVTFQAYVVLSNEAVRAVDLLVLQRPGAGRWQVCGNGVAGEYKTADAAVLEALATESIVRRIADALLPLAGGRP